MSTLKVDNIQHTNGTNAMTIDSSGIVSKPATPSWILLGIPNNIASQAVVGWGQQSYNPGTQSQTNGGVTIVHRFWVLLHLLGHCEELVIYL